MKISDEQIDSLRELINIGVGQSAGILNQMIRSHLTLQVPFIKLISSDSVEEEMNDLSGELLSSVELGLKGKFSGKAALVFPTESASNLVDILTGGETGDSDPDMIKQGTLSEVGNIIVNAVMGSISNILNEHIDYTTPTFKEETISELIAEDMGDKEEGFLLAQARFTAEEPHIQGNFILLFDMDSLKALLNVIDAIKTGS